jgi:hypothetical protein
MSVLVTLCSRDGDVVISTFLFDEKPSIGETVAFTNSKGYYKECEVLKVKHDASRRQHDRDAEVRVFALLDIDKDDV